MKRAGFGFAYLSSLPNCYIIACGYADSAEPQVFDIYGGKIENE